MPYSRWTAPIIVIGAGRSGTNILRDSLAQLADLGTWPCDEINPVWRHGNKKHPTDEFVPEMARPEVREYIRGHFLKIKEKFGFGRLVEKTCANSLRVGFVNAVFPEASFVFIVRDGRDAVASAMKRWRASLDLAYTLRKARFVPWSDLPYYMSAYIRKRFARLLSRERRLPSWGPCFEGMQTMLRSRSLAEVCAAQWQRCVFKAEQDLDELDSSRVYRLRYEDLVRDPGYYLHDMAGFFGISPSREEEDRIMEQVYADSVGNWQRQLKPETVEILKPYIQEIQRRHGYSS
jgi:hypothetical protein